MIIFTFRLFMYFFNFLVFIVYFVRRPPSAVRRPPSAVRILRPHPPSASTLYRVPEKIAFFAFHAFVVEGSRFQQNRVRTKLNNCGACVCKSKVEIRIAGSFCHPQKLYIKQERNLNFQSIILRDKIFKTTSVSPKC